MPETIVHKRGMEKPWPNHIKEWRMAAKMTLEKLGDEAEPPISKGMLSLYERGKRKPSQDTLAAIAKVLGADPGQLISAPPGRTLPPDVIDIWSRIPLENQPHAKEVLKTFTGKSK